jgi:amidohydrolase|tara:strand:+ start:4439 stop:5608 length:1170 start_codon:yes stop_codon:yes gene_type:complete
MIEKIKYLSKKYFEEIVEIRRYLHKNPELSFKEYNTSIYIKKILDDWNIEFEDNIAGNGIVAILKSDDPVSKTVALRADFDALPIMEENNVEYCSINSGVMHACGHDVHTASLLGTLRILNNMKSIWKGTIKFIFQPAEEMLPGGARQMIKEGVLKNPVVKKIFAQHVFPDLEVGKVGFKTGKYMASTDEIYIKVNGKGGHAALKEKYNNPILAASKIIIALDNFFKNKKSIKSVFAIGFVEANGSTNVIPESVYLKGTFRSLDELFRKKSHQNIKKIINIISSECSVTVDLNIKKGYPCLINDNILTKETIKNAKKYLGNDNVVILPERLTAEDFAYFSQKVPACFYRLGTSNISKGINSQLHTSTFNIDENALEISIGLMAYIAIKS